MTCCGRNNGQCVCANEATCSCGKQPALQCTCSKAATENKMSDSMCACGKRPEDACTCSRSDNAGSSELETDLTTKK
ncbi:hypothetical protein BDV95DRAFT_606670 [Massariosphaeria phaeospora]|uniref:DUF7871 domain-containing protein n=1 Tax=Massariosphaeria phaeospora TaxID=100035 RepID=A0A7C8IG09_9PLEO|nr:hypothetical protein BDV95DRAFT_606670 [Massariosphaeria phaeospora]